MPADPVGLTMFCDGFSLTVIKGLSEREALVIHAEIKAMKDRFGLSYKDAAHRLYMAEVARLECLDRAEKGFMELDDEIAKAVSLNICNPILAIDNGDFDGFSFVEGHWKKDDRENK